MLNKIWAGLILTGILFALGQDINDELQNTFQNGVIHPVAFTPGNEQRHSSPLKLLAENVQVTLLIDEYKLIAAIKNHQHLHIKLDQQSPQYLQDIGALHGDKNIIIASIVSKDDRQLNILLPELHWRKLRAVTQAAFDMAEFAVKLAIGLVGIMALWLGLMQIAEKSGMVNCLVKWVRPVLRWLFPNIPNNHPALGSISLNMTANILGLGNAATPLGIKAMQQLQELNPHKNTASDEMCMFLALNTSSVQLLPPVTLIALMGTQVSELMIPIILATSCSTIVAVSVAKLYARTNKQNSEPGK